MQLHYVRSPVKKKIKKTQIYRKSFNELIVLIIKYLLLYINFNLRFELHDNAMEQMQNIKFTNKRLDKAIMYVIYQMHK